MFADELKGNASRKRAEVNRAKRLQLKQKQDAKRSSTVSSSTTASTTTFGASSNVAPTTGLFGLPTTATATAQAATSTTTTATYSQPTALKAPSEIAQEHCVSAVEKARILREQRALEAKRLKSALIIQSFYRCWHSNQKLRAEFLHTLRGRLSDVESLATILKEKKKIDFVPPPATTTALTQQLLWLAKSIPYGKRSVRIREITLDVVETLNGLLRGCIITGISANDEDANPLITWIESSAGKQRLRCLLRLMVCAMMDMRTTQPCMQSIATFFELVLSPPTAKASPRRAVYLAHVKSLLIEKDCSPVPAGVRDERMMQRKIPFFCLGTSLDLIAVVRYFLMFISAGPDPIPTSATDRREKAISDVHRQRGGDLFRLLWNVIQKEPSEMGRMFAFIWTIPLLSWKLSSDALSCIVEPVGGKCPMETMIRAFIEDYTSSTKIGAIDSFLPMTDVQLTMCPAKATQCVLANCFQIGRLCKVVNGSDPKTIDFDFATLYYDFLAVLLDAIPLTSFSSRESAVEWIDDGKGHHTPVVLSPVVLEQCRAITLDSFVRRIFRCAIDTEYFQTESVLAERTDEDTKMEKDLLEASGSSNTALAAREARMDRSKPFWATSKWARRITKNVTSLLGGESKDKAKDVSGQGVLVNSSDISAKLAKGEAKCSEPSIVSLASRRADFSPSLLFSLCRVYSVVLARWGGGGGGDITSKMTDEKLRKVALTKAEAFTMSLLNALCFSTSALRATWGVIQSDRAIKQAVERMVDPDGGSTPIRARHCLCSLAKSPNKRVEEDAFAILHIFVQCLCHFLIVTDDVEIHDFGKPLPLHQIRRVIKMFKKLLYKVCCVDMANSSPCYAGCAMISMSARAMSDLYNRSSRRPICLPKAWLISDLLEKEIRSCKTHEDYVRLLHGPVLRVCPQLVSFKRRLKLFERIVFTNRVAIQGENSPNPFHPNPLKPARVAVIHRGRILEDGLATMNNLGANMRQRISVHYVSETGHKETGVDAGGLFKDFWTDLCAIAFDPNYALFGVTEGAGNCLFPSPLSYSAHGIDHLVLFAFLGRIL